jgi:hypothetical protein
VTSVVRRAPPCRRAARPPPRRSARVARARAGSPTRPADRARPRQARAGEHDYGQRTSRRLSSEPDAARSASHAGRPVAGSA